MGWMPSDGGRQAVAPTEVTVTLAFPADVSERAYRAFLRRLNSMLLDDPTGVKLRRVDSDVYEVVVTGRDDGSLNVEPPIPPDGT
jgi:hypothetical protein